MQEGLGARADWSAGAVVATGAGQCARVAAKACCWKAGRGEPALTFVPHSVCVFVPMAVVKTAVIWRAVLMDACMTWLGLDGRSFVMHLMGLAACAGHSGHAHHA